MENNVYQECVPVEPPQAALLRPVDHIVIVQIANVNVLLQLMLAKEQQTLVTKVCVSAEVVRNVVEQVIDV